jgi:hypothetical protein
MVAVTSASSPVGTHASTSGSRSNTCVPLSTRRCRNTYTIPSATPKVMRALSDALRSEPNPNGNANSSATAMPTVRATRDQNAISYCSVPRLLERR